MSTLFFDLDGTIVNSERGILASARFTLARLGIDPPADEALRRMIGPPLRVMLGTLLGAPDHVETGVRIYREHYGREGLLACDPYPGIGEALARLHGAGHTLFVCTSKMESFARTIIAHNGLTGLFDGIHGAQMGGAGDDKRELLRDILAHRAIDPADAAMIGDRREDIIAGASNGLTTIGVLWGYGDAIELTSAGATALCPNVAELHAILEHSGAQARTS